MWCEDKDKQLADSYMALLYKQFLPTAINNEDAVAVKYYMKKVSEYEKVWGPYIPKKPM